MQRLAWLVGKWETQERYESGILPPADETGSGSEVIRVGPGGLSLIFECEGESCRKAVAAHGEISFDQRTGGYRISAFNKKPPGSPELNGTGDWDEEILAFSGIAELHGKKMAMRLVYYDIGPNSFSTVLYLGEKASGLQPQLQTHYTRISAPE